MIEVQNILKALQLVPVTRCRLPIVFTSSKISLTSCGKCSRSEQKLREAAHQVAQELQAEANSQIETDSEAVSSPKESEQPTLNEIRFADVKALQAEGWSRRAVAGHLNMDRRKVGNYFSAETCPQRQPGWQSTSKATPYIPYLVQRWAEGCQTVTELYDEVVAQGFSGHHMSVYRSMQNLLKDGKINQADASVFISIPNLSVTAATWLLIHTDDRLDDDQRRLRDKLCEISQDIILAYSLVQSFCRLLRERQADQLDSWLEKAEQCGIDVIRGFAAGLQKDYAAVREALIYEWSQGQVEGQVNRLNSSSEKCMAVPILTCYERRLLEQRCFAEAALSHKLREFHHGC